MVLLPSTGSLGRVSERLAGFSVRHRPPSRAVGGEAAGRRVIRVMAGEEGGADPPANPQAATAELEPPAKADKTPKKLPRVDSIPVVARADGMGAPPLLPAAAAATPGSRGCCCPCIRQLSGPRGPLAATEHHAVVLVAEFLEIKDLRKHLSPQASGAGGEAGPLVTCHPAR